MEQAINLIIRKVLFRDSRMARGTWRVKDRHKERKRPDYCWIFNKGSCKDRAKYRFINRCSYCDSAEHGIFACPKAKKAGVTCFGRRSKTEWDLDRCTNPHVNH